MAKQLHELLSEIARLEEELVEAEETVRLAEEARDQIDNSLDFAHRQAVKMMKPGVVVQVGVSRFKLASDDDRIIRV